MKRKPCVDDYIEFLTGTTVEEVVDEGLSLCSVQVEKYDQGCMRSLSGLL